MPRSHQLSGGAADLGALRHVAWTAAQLFGGFLLAAFLGAALAALLRRREGAWTLGLPALLIPAALVALALTGGIPLIAVLYPLSLSSGLAAGLLGWGAHTALEDRRSGGDRAERAERRRGLLDALRRRFAESDTRARAVLADGIPFGRDSRGVLACLPRGSAASGSHVLIPGATGAGKTTSLAALLVEYVVRSGFGAIVLEAKSDAALLAAARGAAAERGVPFRIVSPQGTDGYDPLASGSVDERSERLLAAQAWGSEDADFYRQAASPFLRLALRVLDASARPTLAAVARLCHPDELEAAAINSPLSVEVAEALAALRADERRAIAGLAARLRNLASSDFARAWLDPTRAGVHQVRLADAVAAREVVYFRFDTDRTGSVGRALAQIVLLDLGAVASARMGEGTGTFVAVDEFGALEAPALDRLFARGRAAGFSVALGTQTLADLRAAGPAVRERVGATVSAIACHRLGSQADAEWVAQLIGTVPAWESTVRTGIWGLPTASGTRTRGHRFEVNPAELQRLGRGEAVLARLDRPASQRSFRIRVVPAWRRLARQGVRSTTGSERPERRHPR